MIRRVEFDDLLLSLALEAGAVVVSNADIVRARELGDAVQLEARDGRTFEAPIVIAADGVHSIVARRLGINPGWAPRAVAVDMMEETPREALRADPSTLWVSYGYSAGGDREPSRATAAEGYAYIFPKRDHVNIGIGYVLDHFRRHVEAKPYDLQRQFVRRLRERGLVEGDSVRGNFTPFIIPVGGPLKKPGRGRVLAAGDAGGFVNGFTAEGIYYAMVTGELAAQTILRTSAGDVPARLDARYAAACDAEVGTELRDSVLVQRHLFADPRRIARVIAAASSNAAVTKLVLDYAIGRAPYRQVRRRVIAAAPLAAVRLLLLHLQTRRLPARARGTTISQPTGQT
jgi:flavin-dependent dehydrogenase